MDSTFILRCGIILHQNHIKLTFFVKIIQPKQFQVNCFLRIETSARQLYILTLHAPGRNRQGAQDHPPPHRCPGGAAGAARRLGEGPACRHCHGRERRGGVPERALPRPVPGAEARVIRRRGRLDCRSPLRSATGGGKREHPPPAPQRKMSIFQTVFRDCCNFLEKCSYFNPFFIVKLHFLHFGECSS